MYVVIKKIGIINDWAKAAIRKGFKGPKGWKIHLPRSKRPIERGTGSEGSCDGTLGGGK